MNIQRYEHNYNPDKMHMIKSKTTTYAINIMIDMLNTIIEDMKISHVIPNSVICNLYNMNKTERISKMNDINFLYLSKIESSVDYNIVHNLLHEYDTTNTIYRYMIYKRTEIMIILHYTIAKQLYPKANIKILYDRNNNHTHLMIDDYRYDIFNIVNVNMKKCDRYESYSNLYSFCRMMKMSNIKKILMLNISLNIHCPFLLKL